MTHSLKTIWIAVFSIIAMLSSGYVSSSPAMSVKMMHHAMESTGSSAIVNPQHITVEENSGPLYATTPAHSQHHTGSHCEPQQEITQHQQTENDATTRLHCGETESDIHSCCLSVCSSVFYPIQHTKPFTELAYSLALRQRQTIGDTIARVQNILRPPSA
ncbi:hypothetical protein [Thaumasiovibrio sp. DFM-14]|uniref:hypothetical protein n=1 Tax=Thaumasiovibrio sp. DFM-14 TaxID=3384792 RepID=UPI00399FF3FD